MWSRRRRPTHEPERPGVLVDPELDRELGARGHVTVPLLDRSTANELRDAYLASAGARRTGFEADLTNPDTAHRREVRAVASQLVGDIVGRLLVDHEPFLWSYLCKWPDEPEDLYLHRDWWFVDERSGARTHLVWIALQDIDESNGPLKILPNTHLMPPEPTGSDLAPSWLGRARTLEDRLVTVGARAGEAIVMDHALVHGSYRNTSAEPRVVLGCAVHPRSVPLAHFRRADGATAHRFEVTPEFFVTYTPEGLLAAPPDLVPAETFAVAFDESGAPDLADRLDRLHVGQRRDRHGN